MTWYNRLRYIAITCVLALSCAVAQVKAPSNNPSSAAGQPGQQPPLSTPAPSPQSRIDPAKEADIRRLLELTGAKAMVAQSMEATEKNMKPLLLQSLPAGEYREKLIELFFAKFHSKIDAEHLVDLAIPVYDKYFSQEEIKGLLQFYQTPLGQKALDVLPRLTAELQENGAKWGRQAGRDSMLEVLLEHPELAKALEEANKAAQKR